MKVPPFCVCDLAHAATTARIFRLLLRVTTRGEVNARACSWRRMNALGFIQQVLATDVSRYFPLAAIRHFTIASFRALNRPVYWILFRNTLIGYFCPVMFSRHPGMYVVAQLVMH